LCTEHIFSLKFRTISNFNIEKSEFWQKRNSVCSKFLTSLFLNSMSVLLLRRPSNFCCFSLFLRNFSFCLVFWLLTIFHDFGLSLHGGFEALNLLFNDYIHINWLLYIVPIISGKMVRSRYFRKPIINRKPPAKC
jgi:hypothetical protein